MSQETELIDAVLRGDTAQFDILLRPHEQTMRGAANRLLRRTCDVEDTLQEAKMRIFLYLRQFQYRSEFRTWVIRIVINTAFMHLRKTRKESFDVRAERLDEFPDSRSFCFDWAAIQDHARLASATRAAIRSLPPIYQEVVTLRFLEDENLSETARKLSISIPAVKSRQFRALRMLRSRLMVYEQVAA